MKSEQRLRDFTLRFIQILVWFEILWAAVFLAGLVFQWSGLTDQLASAFFGSGFCAVLVLLALVLLNVVTNLNIISKVQVQRMTGADVEESKPGSFIKTIGIAGGLIGLVILSLWFAEWRLYQAKVSQSETKIESLVGTDLLDEALDLVKQDGPASELAKVREALATSVQSGARLSFILPRKVKDVTVYYESTAWWYGQKDQDKKISEVSLPRFVPINSERDKWEEMIKGEIKGFSVSSGENLRTFRRIVKDGQELILLIDTGRRSDYKRSSF
ncbi:MAG: hypothetical protein GXP49_04915 [Deltaproteobacteria bacterium]|nr:hypothetical protein [Deltaproteobacteria bacterium]